MTSLVILMATAETLGETADNLKRNIDAMERQINSIRLEFLKKIMPLSKAFSEQKVALEKLVEDNPQHFVKPRTIEVNGVKFGMAKKSGKVTFDDAEAVIAKVKVLLTGKQNMLVQTKESLNIRGLYVLSDMERKAIGVGKLPDNPNTVVVQIKAVDEMYAIVAKMMEELSEKRTDEKLKLAS